MNRSNLAAPEKVENKRVARLAKNREAAKECRRKKKDYIKSLEDRVNYILSELPIASNNITLGNSIACNLKNIYFSLGIFINRGEVGILPICDTGKKNFSVPKIVTSASTYAFFNHQEAIVSIATTPLDSSILATVCETERVALILNLRSKYGKIASLNHPNIFWRTLGISGFIPVRMRPDTGISILYYVITADFYSGASMSSFSWKDDGSFIVCYAEVSLESSIFLIPASSHPVRQENKFEKSLTNPKLFWAGNTDYFMAFAYEKALTSRSAYAWDVRNLKGEFSKKSIDSSASMFYPCYDSDTNMIVLASRGSRSAHFLEFGNTGFSSIRTDQYDCDSFGICCVPRNLLNVMSCEVMRIMQLSKSKITPISYHVIRKSYTSFYPELFPDATNKTASIRASEWFHGSNRPLDRVSLNPLVESKSEASEHSLSPENFKVQIENKSSFTRPAIFDNPETHSKFKNIFGTKLHQRFQHEMLINLERKTPAETNGISVNFDTIAIPLIGGLGKIGILKLSQPGRTPDCGPFYVENRSQVCDFELDKKNDNLLGVICEDSSINIWKLPPNGLQSNLLQSDIRFVCNRSITIILVSNDRCTILKFHPCASGVLCTSGLDGCLRIWDIVKKAPINACNLPTRSQAID
ncbi:hypothetical protein MXB_2066 [Myxobolus squamalis]|nr:hypothetical protein MXB_2066 [Myxobolus squamalis]